MDIGVQLKLEVADTAAYFGWMLTPPFEHPDRMSRITAPEYQAIGCKVDKDLGVLMLNPIPGVQDTNLTDWTTTAWTLNGPTKTPVANAWKQGTDAETNCASIQMVNSTNGIYWEALTDDDISLEMNQPWYLKIGRGLSAATSTSGATYNVDTVITIGADSDSGTDIAAGGVPVNGYPIRINLLSDYPPSLEYAVPDGNNGWTWTGYGIVGTNISKCSDLFNQSGRTVTIYCIPIPDLNVFLVDIGNGLERLVFRPGVLTPLYSGNNQITYQSVDTFTIAPGTIDITGTNGVAYINYFPMYFTNEATFQYNQIQLSFTYAQNGTIDLSNSVIPDGTEVDWELVQLDDTGNLLGYQLSISGLADISDSLSSTTPYIAAVYTKMPATYENITVGAYQTFTESDIQEVHEVEELLEHPSEDVDGMMDGWTISKRVGIKFTNWAGQWLNNQNSKNWAAQFSRGLTILDDSTGKMVPLDPLNPYTPFVTGMFGEQSFNSRSDPNRTFDIVMEDLSGYHMNQPGLVQDYQDGRCALAVMRAEALRAGILPQFISNDPYFGFGSCPDTFNPEGCNHFKLPIGTALNPSFAFSPTSTYWSNIQRIAGMMHEIVAFNQYGVLSRAPYVDYIYNEAPYKGIFSTTDSGDVNDVNFLMGILGHQPLVLNNDTFNRRTAVLVVGADPNTGIRIVANLNADTIMGQGWSEYTVGYPKPEAVVSRLFTDATTVNTVMNSLMSKALIPTQVLTFGTHFLPNLWVGDQIDVTENGFVIGGTMRCSVIKMERTYVNDGHNKTLNGVCTARWLSNM